MSVSRTLNFRALVFPSKCEEIKQKISNIQKLHEYTLYYIDLNNCLISHVEVHIHGLILTTSTWTLEPDKLEFEFYLNPSNCLTGQLFTVSSQMGLYHLPVEGVV